jgi:hypothetical protein
MRIAIDTSGSTAGGTSDAEIRAIKEISTTIKSQKASLLILPWNSRASAPISPKNKMQNPGSTGGTKPSSLYGNPDCLKALQNYGLWFLFTDGQISKAEVENFALNTATYGLHGTPNVVIIFGGAADTLPVSWTFPLVLSPTPQLPTACYSSTTSRLELSSYSKQKVASRPVSQLAQHSQSSPRLQLGTNSPPSRTKISPISEFRNQRNWPQMNSRLPTALSSGSKICILAPHPQKSSSASASQRTYDH